jgi:hypothetical protein
MDAKYAHLKIKILKEDYQYSLLKSNEDLLQVNSFFKSIKEPVAIFLSDEELSLMAPTHLSQNLNTEKAEPGWLCFRIVGPMPFGTVQGLISNISNVLFREQIGVCIVSTFKSDWFFIRSKYQEKAVVLLTNEGWRVEKES